MSKNKKEFDEEFSNEKISTEEKAEPVKKYISVYCGPDFPKFGLKAFRIYEGGLPLYVTEAAKHIPEILRLIVPYDQLETMREKTAFKGTPEYEYYEAIRSHAAASKALA